jgi:hypothetical protein
MSGTPLGAESRDDMRMAAVIRFVPGGKRPLIVNLGGQS